MVVDWDTVEGARVRKTRQVLEIYRTCVVSQVPIDCSVGGTDPSVLLKVLSVLPSPGALHPDPTYPAVLEDYEIVAVKAVDTVVVALIYRLNLTLGDPTAPGTWIKSTDTLYYQEETYSTALGSKSIKVYYTPGGSPGTGVPPASAYQRIGKARKFRGYKVMTVTGRMYYNTWLATVEPLIAPAEFKINSDAWGAYARGKWMYMGAKVDVPLLATTSSAVLVATITCKYLYEPLGHYALMAYLNERREHPNDAISESSLRAIGLPAVDDIVMRNGKTLASVYAETTFSDKFAFVP